MLVRYVNHKSIKTCTISYFPQFLMCRDIPLMTSSSAMTSGSELAMQWCHTLKNTRPIHLCHKRYGASLEMGIKSSLLYIKLNLWLFDKWFWAASLHNEDHCHNTCRKALNFRAVNVQSCQQTCLTVLPWGQNSFGGNREIYSFHVVSGVNLLWNTHNIWDG